jgi:signal transduction histidine kinase
VATGRSHAARRGVVIEADLSTAATIGHAPLLRRMVGNLVENGVTYNRAGGWLRLRLRLSASGSGPTLEVANSGPVVARDRVESLFEPFRRLEGDRTSTSGLGLGLSIVRAVVHAHGGTIQAAPGREGGLEITVGLPGARQPARR